MPVTEQARIHTTTRTIAKLIALVFFSTVLAGINACNNTKAVDIKAIEGRIACVQEGNAPLECREIFPR